MRNCCEPIDWEREVIGMPRGELAEFVLLCSYEDRSHNLHGIGMRKSTSGSVKIEIASVEKSSFSEVHGLIVRKEVGSETRTLRVNPELVHVQSHSSLLQRFSDDNDVKDSISLLLIFTLGHVLHKYHGFCMIQTPHAIEAHPAFVFISSSGRFTALPTTTTTSRMPAAVYVNHLQPALHERSFWRATCFELLESQPQIEPWANEVDVHALRSVIITNVLTFNAINCQSEELCDEDGVYQETMNSIPCPYARDF